jgi:uncharacterized membrane protein YraQ (UPF0718 family)
VDATRQDDVEIRRGSGDSEPPRSSAAPPARAGAGALLLLALILAALFYTKWGASLRAMEAVRGSGKLPIAPATILEGGVLATTLAYLHKIGLALVYGILVGAVVRAAIPASWVRRWLGHGEGGRGRASGATLVGALAGMPLMLCSCCVTPVFTGVYERGARLGSALALLLASPGLNVAALALTFALLPTRVGLLRLAAALLIVLGLSAVVGGTLGESARRPFPEAGDLEETGNRRQRVVAFVRSIGYLVLVTVPWIVAGAALSSWLLPHLPALTGTATVAAVVVVALVATLVALPTFFEIPIGLLLLSMGAPVPVVVAFVVAGPAVNLPSLLVLARETGLRVALALGAGVWLIATAAGLLALRL